MGTTVKRESCCHSSNMTWSRVDLFFALRSHLHVVNPAIFSSAAGGTSSPLSYFKPTEVKGDCGEVRRRLHLHGAGRNGGTTVKGSRCLTASRPASMGAHCTEVEFCRSHKLKKKRFSQPSLPQCASIRSRFQLNTRVCSEVIICAVILLHLAD